MVVGAATLGEPLELAVMDFFFMGGSIGSAVGEKFVRAADAAIAAGIPLLLVTSSGSARMQEGILSLMQLPKTIAAIDELHEAGLPLFCLLADPTTGGAMASFATLGDVIVAELDALLAFTGPRVVQELVKEKLSERLRPLRAAPPLRADRRHRSPIRAAPLHSAPPSALCPVRPSARCGSGSAG